MRVAGRLVAALGQAILYAAVNDNHRQDFPALDAKQAAEAVSGLGLAINQCRASEQVITVDAEIVEHTRATLETFRDLLRSRAWSSCPCGERHGQAKTDAQVLKAVQRDLLLLPTR